MKILAALLLLTTNSLTESSPPFNNIQLNNQPQSIYGPPQLPRIQTAPFRPFPQKQTLPDTYGPPQRVTNAQQGPQNAWRVVQNANSPQTTYGVPARQTGQVNSYRIPSRQIGSSWQVSVGVNAQQGSLGSPSGQTWNNGVSALPTSYETLPRQLPNRFNAPQTTYGAPQRQTLDPRRLPTAPQSQNVNSWQPLNNNDQRTFYRAPERLNSVPKLPQTQYGSPEINNVETLDRLRALTSIGSQSLPLRQPGVFKTLSQPQNLPEPGKQYLPTTDSIDFRSAPNWNQNVQGNDLDLPLPNLVSSVEVQKLELKTLYPPLGDGDVELKAKNVNAADYLPSTTTAVPILKTPTRTTPRPVTTPKSDEDNQRDADDPAKETGERPNNVAIATAVAGGVGEPGEQQFYLLQPDGRLQRVVYRKTRQEDDAADEYTVDYRFQNVQGDPNYVYAPLVTLG